MSAREEFALVCPECDTPHDGPDRVCPACREAWARIGARALAPARERWATIIAAFENALGHTQVALYLGRCRPVALAGDVLTLAAWRPHRAWIIRRYGLAIRARGTEVRVLSPRVAAERLP